jgi:hypothetical protein
MTRLFVLERTEDVSGVSGTGTVADGVLWPTGQVCVCWRGPRSSIAVWQTLDDAIAIHGHDGKTKAVFLD